MKLQGMIGAGVMMVGVCGMAASGQCQSAKACGASAGDATMVQASWAPEAKGSWGETKNIVEVAAGAGTFNTLIAAAKAAGLAETLMGEGPFTVFAPTDEAFAALPEGTVQTLLRPENKDKLAAILLYHVVPGKAKAADVLGKKSWTTAGGQRIDISSKGGKAMVDGATIVKTDIAASNGVIHVIDAVLMPETRTIPEVAGAAGSFSTLIAAVKAAGLAETLMGDGPFTVFAPTDEAFAALGSTVTDLLRPENKAKLASILTYHVVPGRVYADQVAGLTSVTTVNGAKAPITAKGDWVKIDGARVVSADIEASNGVIHVIDAVILPE